MSKKKAFTLIELLVVIAIIALLLAILIPSLKKAKEKASQTVCKTNLKGIGLAIKLHLNDNEDKSFAYTKDRNVRLHGNGYKWTDPATGQLLDSQTDNTYWGLPYNKYTKNPKVFSCPSFEKYKIDLAVYYPEYAKSEDDVLGGYAINEFFQKGFDLKTGYMQVNKIRVPSEFILAQDHVEPRPEDRDGDMFYIKSGQTFNLQDYRAGGPRLEAYRGIFRHSKKSNALDNPAGDTTRRNNIINNPNGQSDTLWLDGSVTGMNETTGQDVRRSWYSGN